MIKVNVLSDEKSWSKKIRYKDRFFNKIFKLSPQKYRFKNKKVYLTLLLSNNKNIKKLNNKFRNKNKHTDILSFPFGENIKNKKEIYLGDIIISYNYINFPKNQTNLQFKENVIKIFIHGFLHLLGFDHKKNDSYKKMLKEEQLFFKTVIKILN
tara:strand:- start:477 stop:938 length:462 start_codon:yes stop_codon:yes gene_type:complete